MPAGRRPYTAAAEALGIPFSWAHSPSHVVDEAGRPIVDRLSVTKSLTSVDPDHPELRAAVAAGIPVEAWQQVVADVALTAGQRLLADHRHARQVHHERLGDPPARRRGS